jgi:isochorismate pyruvate lyase
VTNQAESHRGSAEAATCVSLDEVRVQIDRVDRLIVALIAERGDYVRQAAGFKRNEAEVQAPQRVQQVIKRVRGRATDTGADPDIVEAVYRAMINGFIGAELRTHQSLQQANSEQQSGN